MTLHGRPDDDPLADADHVLPPEPLTVREIVGRNLLRMRLDVGASHEDIVRAARGYDLEWSLTWLTGVERGQKSISAEQLVALPVVLSDALGYKIGMTDLFYGDEPVQLGKDPAAARSQLPVARVREVLTATPYRRVFSGPSSPHAGAQTTANAVSRAAEKMREISRAGLGDLDSRALSRAEAGAGELEEKLARRLAVSPIVVIAAAAGLWGHSLTEERAKRLATGVDEEVPQRLRNAVMRKLTAELTERLAEAETAAQLAAQEAEADRLAAEPTRELPTITPRWPQPRTVDPDPRPAIALGGPLPPTVAVRPAVPIVPDVPIAPGDAFDVPLAAHVPVTRVPLAPEVPEATDVWLAPAGPTGLDVGLAPDGAAEPWPSAGPRHAAEGRAAQSRGAGEHRRAAKPRRAEEPRGDAAEQGGDALPELSGKPLPTAG